MGAHAIEIHFHLPPAPFDPRIDQILGALRQLQSAAADQYRRDSLMAGTIADLEADVAAQTTVVASVEVLVAGFAQRLADAVASGDPVAIQAAQDEINANTARLAAAVVQGTPAEVPPVEVPVEPAP